MISLVLIISATQFNPSCLTSWSFIQLFVTCKYRHMSTYEVGWLHPWGIHIKLLKKTCFWPRFNSMFINRSNSKVDSDTRLSIRLHYNCVCFSYKDIRGSKCWIIPWPNDILYYKKPQRVHYDTGICTPLISSGFRSVNSTPLDRCTHAH